MNFEIINDFTQNNLKFNFKEYYHYLILKEENWRNYNQLYPYPGESIISLLYQLSRNYQICSKNVHYSICLIQRYLGLIEFNKNNVNSNGSGGNIINKEINEIQISIIALNISCKLNQVYWCKTIEFKSIVKTYFEKPADYCKIEIEFLEIIKFHLTVPLVSDFVGIIIEGFYLNQYQENLYKSIIDFIYYRPKQFLSKPFTQLALSVLCITFSINDLKSINNYIKWASLISNYSYQSFQLLIDSIIKIAFNDKMTLKIYNEQLWLSTKINNNNNNQDQNDDHLN